MLINFAHRSHLSWFGLPGGVSPPRVLLRLRIRGLHQCPTAPSQMNTNWEAVNNRNFFSQSCGGQKSKLKVSRGCNLSEAPGRRPSWPLPVGWGLHPQLVDASLQSLPPSAQGHFLWLFLQLSLCLLLIRAPVIGLRSNWITSATLSPNEGALWSSRWT